MLNVEQIPPNPISDTEFTKGNLLSMNYRTVLFDQCSSLRAFRSWSRLDAAISQDVQSIFVLITVLLLLLDILFNVSIKFELVWVGGSNVLRVSEKQSER
jgi:hypothetical protein